MKKIIIFIPFLFILSITLANAGVLCNENKTHDLEECAKNNFKSSDDILNKTYKTFYLKLSKEDRGILLNAQRAWIKYKDGTCQDAYDMTYPGEEAGIDKWNCLDEVTRSRIKEIDYLDSGIGADGFVHALNIVSKIYEGGNKERFMEKLSNQSADKSDQHWNNYVSQNCLLAVRRLHEEKRLCVARQNFYRYP